MTIVTSRRRAHQLEGGRDLLEDLLADRPAVDERIAPGVVFEGELPEGGEPAHELLGERLVEPVEPDQVLDRLRRDAARTGSGRWDHPARG